MCIDGISHHVLADPTVQRLMANPILDFVHHQVLMALYSLECNDRLDEYKQVLPVYLQKDWSGCDEILKALEQAGLVTRAGDDLQLTVKVEGGGVASCGCG
jgi:hypothetical protein